MNVPCQGLGCVSTIPETVAEKVNFLCKDCRGPQVEILEKVEPDEEDLELQDGVPTRPRRKFTDKQKRKYLAGHDPAKESLVRYCKRMDIGQNMFVRWRHKFADQVPVPTPSSEESKSEVTADDLIQVLLEFKDSEVKIRVILKTAKRWIEILSAGLNHPIILEPEEALMVTAQLDVSPARMAAGLLQILVNQIEEVLK